MKEWVKTSNKNTTKDIQETIFALVVAQMDMESKTVESYDLDHEVKQNPRHINLFAKKKSTGESNPTWLKVGDRNTAYFHR